MDEKPTQHEHELTCACGRPRKPVPYRGPTGSISLIASYCPGIEPQFGGVYKRTVRTKESK